jgi:hypothetical protein
MGVSFGAESTPSRLLLVEENKRNDCGVDEALARMLEINRNAVADRGLDLAHAPIGLARVAHASAWYQPVVQERLPQWLSGSASQPIIAWDRRPAQEPATMRWDP